MASIFAPFAVRQNNSVAITDCGRYSTNDNGIAMTQSQLESPSVTALVCTRNRGERIADTVESLLANTSSSFEVVIVDQSTDDVTERAMSKYSAVKNLRYIRSSSKGLGLARNIGLSVCRSDIVAMTDDDCTVPANWLEVMAAAFQDRPKVAVAFCTVEAAPYDRTNGTVPVFECRGARGITSVGQWCGERAIGAGMAVRRSLLVEIGEFDEQLGAGALFPSHEDADIALRALLRGFQVYETEQVSVIHDGFRSWEQYRELIQRDFMGIGAGLAKLLRCGRWRVFGVIACDAWRLALGPAVSSVLHLKAPRVATRLQSLMRGFRAGWRTPIDKKRMVFLPAASERLDTIRDPTAPYHNFAADKEKIER